jgi:tetratricopeptide (TPR) repeat protein
MKQRLPILILSAICLCLLACIAWTTFLSREKVVLTPTKSILVSKDDLKWRTKLRERAAWLYFWRDEWQSAVVLETVIEEFPWDEETVAELGWIYESNGRERSALALYRTYAANNPWNPDRTLYEAIYHKNKRDWAKIPPLLADVIKENPHPNVYRLLARAYKELGRAEDARKIWETYLSRFPDDAQAKRNLSSL